MRAPRKVFCRRVNCYDYQQVRGIAAEEAAFAWSEILINVLQITFLCAIYPSFPLRINFGVKMT